MLELIELIRKASNRQIFISTHCNLIATRLNLKKCLLFNSASTNVASLSNLPDDTANFLSKPQTTTCYNLYYLRNLF